MLHRAIRVGLTAVLAAVLVPVGGAPSDSQRAAVPKADAIVAARDEVQDALREELRVAADGGDIRGMIATLKEYARESSDPVRKFAFLDVAEQLAIDSHQYSLAMSVAAQKVLQFDVTDMPTRIRILDAVAASENVDDLVYGIDFATSVLADSVGTEEFAASKQILEGLRTMVSTYAAIEKAQEAAIRRKYPQLYRSTLLNDKVKPTGVKQAWDKVFRHRRRDEYESRLAKIEATANVVEERRATAANVKGSTNDPTVGPVVGRYICFDQFDWDNGLRFLALDRGELGSVARAEAKTGSVAAEGIDAVSLADRWWRLAGDTANEEGALPNDAAAMQSHAADLYRKALQDLPDGYEKEVARKRIGQAAVPRVLYAVEADAAQCSTAAEAVQVYTMFLAKDSISQPMRRAGEVRLQCWKQRADQQFQRFGTEWISRAEHDSRVKKAADRVRHVGDLIRLGNIALAKEELDQASNLDPTSGKADYLIGLVNALGFNNILLAAYYFGEAARREPDNGYFVCALANAEILLNQPELARRHYLQALEHLPDQFVVENLGVVLRRATRLGLDDEATRRFNQIYRQAIHDLRLSPADADSFLFLAPFAVDRQAEGDEGNDSRETQEAVQIVSGTGFVVGPKLVLTNHHVVDGCTEIMVVDPKNRDRQLVAKLIASTENPDLALLECDTLDAPALAMAERLPPRGEDIMCLGFPGGSILGLALKSTRGSVISLGDEGLDGGNFLHSCIINPGNSGGPIVDQTGALVGVVVAVVKTSLIGNAYGIGIPVERVRTFLDREIKKYQDSKPVPAASAEAPPASPPAEMPAEDRPEPAAAETPLSNQITWGEVDAKVSPSTVFIIGKIRSRPDGGTGVSSGASGTN